MSDTLTVKIRESRGKRDAKRMREAGSTPAIIYGMGKESVSLTIPTSEVDAAVRHGSRVVTLNGDVSGSALIKEVQWDTFGMEIFHIDLNRIDASSLVELSLSVELRGDAPGTKVGGQVKQLIHEINFECPSTAVPEKLEVNINALELDQSLTVSDVVLPEGSKLLTSADGVVVQCVLVEESSDDDSEDGSPSEPEVIGKKDDEEE